MAYIPHNPNLISGRMTEFQQAWLESLVYQSTILPHDQVRPPIFVANVIVTNLTWLSNSSCKCSRWDYFRILCFCCCYLIFLDDWVLRKAVKENVSKDFGEAVNRCNSR